MLGAYKNIHAVVDTAQRRSVSRDLNFKPPFNMGAFFIGLLKIRVLPNDVYFYGYMATIAYIYLVIYLVLQLKGVKYLK